MRGDQDGARSGAASPGAVERRAAWVTGIGTYERALIALVSPSSVISATMFNSSSPSALFPTVARCQAQTHRARRIDAATSCTPHRERTRSRA
jgi:hypothetical protein